MADNPLHKAPLGLLGAFALKVLGRNPDKFGEVVVPSVDVYDQYLALELGEVKSQPDIAIGARTQAAQFTPVMPYAYRVLAIGCNLALDAADIALTGTLITSVTSPAVAGVQIEPNGTMTKNGATGTWLALGHYLPRPLFLPPGYFVNMRMLLSANVTAVTTVTFSMLIQRLEL